MSVTITNYDRAKTELREATEWVGLIGAPYNGGGGGVGAILSKTIHLDVEVYHQAYDGAKNFHPAPPGLHNALAAAVHQHFPVLLATAQAMLQENVRQTAALARESALRILADAISDGASGVESAHSCTPDPGCTCFTGCAPCSTCTSSLPPNDGEIGSGI